MIDLGTVLPGSTIRIPFSSFDKDDGSSITMTNYAAADILIYKDGSTTERASTAGFTATTDFDGKTGKHLAIIDLADDTTADFYKAGSEYLVAIDAVTVDAVTTGGWIARFRIGYPGAQLDTSIATLASQTSFTLTAGPAEDDALNGHELIVHDKASAVQSTRVVIEDYTGSTKTVTLRAVPAATFTIAAGDNVSVREMVRVDVTHLLGTAWLTPGTAGTPDVNTKLVGGTSQTGRDLGASVLLSSGSGAGQVNLLSGKVLVQGTIDQFDDFVDASGKVTLTSATIQAIWDVLTTSLTTVGSIGKLFVDRIDAAITSRAASATALTNATWTDARAAKLDNLDATVSSRSTVTTAQVNTEVVDALNVDTYAEPGQGAPAATTTLVGKIGYLYKAWRNKKDSDGATENLYNDDAATVDQKRSVSEAAGTVTKGEVATGP